MDKTDNCPSRLLLLSTKLYSLLSFLKAVVTNSISSLEASTSETFNLISFLMLLELVEVFFNSFAEIIKDFKPSSVFNFRSIDSPEFRLFTNSLFPV